MNVKLIIQDEMLKRFEKTLKAERGDILSARQKYRSKRASERGGTILVLVPIGPCFPRVVNGQRGTRKGCVGGWSCQVPPPPGVFYNNTTRIAGATGRVYYEGPVWG